MSESAAGGPRSSLSLLRRYPKTAVLIGLGGVLVTVGLMRGRRSPATGMDLPPMDEAEEATALLVADLIGVARQGARALRRAGMALPDERLRLMLRDVAMERGHTAALLQQCLQERGVPAVHGLEPTGDVVPEWTRVERLLRAGDAAGILDAVAAAEASTLDRFRQALRCPLPDDIRLILGERLFAEIEPSRNRLSALSAIHS